MAKPGLNGEVVLTRDMPREDLKEGEVADAVDYLAHPAGGEGGAILEFFNNAGESVDVVDVPVSALELLSSVQVSMVRKASSARG